MAEQLALLLPVFSGSVRAASPGFPAAREAVSSRRPRRCRGPRSPRAPSPCLSRRAVLRKFGRWAAGSEPRSLLPPLLVQPGLPPPAATPFALLERWEGRQCPRGGGPGSARPGRGLAEAGARAGPGRAGAAGRRGAERRRRRARPGVADCGRAGGRTGAPAHGGRSVRRRDRRASGPGTRRDAAAALGLPGAR